MDRDFFSGRLKLQHLLVALAVAEEGSAVAAAQKLFLSQPSVTRSIQELEDILGAPLFERSSHGMRLVRYGEPFLDHVRAALSHIRVGAQQVREIARGQAGTVVVGVHLAGANRLLPRSIASLKSERPLVDVVVREGVPEHLLELVALGDVDLMLTRRSFADAHREAGGEELHFEHLYEEVIAIASGPQSMFTGSTALELSDLADEQWILPARGTTLRTELEAAFTRSGTALPKRTVECSSPATVALLIAEGGFIGAMPRSAASAIPDVTILDVIDCHIGSDTGVVWVRDHVTTPTAQLMLDHLRSAASAMAEPPHSS